MKNSKPTFKTANVVNSLVALALLVCAIAGCKQLQKATEKAVEPSVLTSADGKFQITVPGTWRKNYPNSPEAEISAGNPLDETYMLVLIESKVDFTDETTLDTYTDIIHKSMSSKLTEPKSSSPVSLTINGNPARQYQLQGAMENVKLAYIITTVETAEHFHQIVTWTLLSRLDQNQSTLRTVTESFRPTR